MNAKLMQLLAERGLVSQATAASYAKASAGGVVEMGDPLPEAELLALAEIAPEDIARAVAGWEATAPGWAKGLLDAKPTTET